MLKFFIIFLISIFSISFSEIAHSGVITEAPSISEVLLRVLKFLLYISGTFAIISIVVSGIMFVIFSTNERMIEKAKDALRYSILGLMVVLLSLAIVTTLTRIIGQ